MLYVLNLLLLSLLVSCVFSQRVYTTTLTGNADGDCGSIEDVYVYFTSDSGTSTSTFACSEGGGEYSGSSSSEADIGTIQYINLAVTNSDSLTVCFDYLEFAVNSTTTRACSGLYQGMWGLNFDCGDGGQAAVPSMRLDVSESSPICWNYYNSDSSDTSKTPYYEENGWNVNIDTAPSGTRSYSVSLLTGSGTNCDTSNYDVSVQLQTNCTFMDREYSGATALYCDPLYVIRTSLKRMTPGGLGEWGTLEFDDTDIGNVTYLYVQFNDSNTDGWCLDEFIVMTKYSAFGANDGLSVREYARCNISTFYYDGVVFDGDCSDDLDYSGYKFFTVRADSLAPYCNIYTEKDESSSPSLMPSDMPSSMPSKMPSLMPSIMPTDATGMPSLMPSGMPSMTPSEMPVAVEPSGMPTKVPTGTPVASGSGSGSGSGNAGVSNNNVNPIVYCLLLLFASVFVFVF